MNTIRMFAFVAAVLITVAVVALALGSTGSWHWWSVLRFRQSTATQRWHTKRRAGNS